MSVYKDEQRNTWYVTVRYTNWQGERKQKVKRGFVTRKSALSWEREFLQTQQADLSMQFEAFVGVYFADKDGRLKERSMRNKRYMINAKVLPYFGKLAVNAVKPSDILNWQNAMLAEGYSETYLRMLRNQVTAIFNHAERFYGLKDNPCRKAGKIGRSNASKMNFWTVAEFEKFERTFRSEEELYRVLFLVLFWTGCREGEALALTLQDIDFDSEQMTINKTYYRHECRDIITKPKTEKANRIITLPHFLCVELTAYTQRVYGMSATDRLFAVGDRAVQKKLKSKAEAAELTPIRVHDLRHSHIAFLIDKGVSPLAIAKRVGHESVNTTLNVYGHLYPNKQQEIAQMIDAEGGKSHGEKFSRSL